MRNDNTKTVKPSNLLKKALCYMLTTVMVISGFNMVPGAAIESEAADAWKFIELEEGRYKITPTYKSTLALDNDNGNVKVKDSNGSEYQSWIIRKNEYEDSYAITNAATGGLLDVEGLASGLKDDLNIALIDPVANPSNLSETCAFKIAQYSSGTFTYNSGYYIYCGINGSIYVADVDTSLTSGNNVKTYHVHNTENEHWDFTPVTYTVTFAPNGGTGNPYSQTIYYDRDTELLVNEFTREGYTFAGWSTSSDGNVKYSNNQIITDNLGAIETGANANKVTLYAQWTKTQATVTFDKQGGTSGASGSSSLTVTPNKAVPSINVPQRDGYVFDGYYTAQNGGGKNIFDKNGDVIKPVADYIDENGKWIGGTNDITLYANWVLVNSNIKFFNMEGDFDNTTPIETININKGENVPSVKVPTIAGSEFLGFFTKSGSTEIKLFDTTGHPVNATNFIQDGKWISNGTNINVYAKWNVINFSITFSPNVEKDFFTESNAYANSPEPTGDIPVEQDISDRKFFTTVPTRTGYTFAGYADELTGGTLVLGTDGKIAANDVKSSLNGQIIKGGKWVLPGQITLYAQWTPNTYNFKFDKNTGDGNDVELKNVDISNGYPETVTIAKQSKPGQALLGFSATKITDSTTVDNPETKDIDELASALIYKASADDTTIFKFDKDTVTARPVGTDNPATENIDESRDITLYAVWGTANYQVAYYDRDWDKINDVDVTIDNVSNSRINEGEGDVKNPEQFKYGQFMLQSLKELGYTAPEITKNYKFLGWSTEPYAKKADYEAGKQYQGGLTTTPGEIVKLYAVWVKTNGANISFNGNGSNDAPATHVPADDEVIFDKVDGNNKKYAEYKIESRYQPIREGYKFLGWSKTATDTTNLLVPGDTGVTVNIYEDTVFYAQWEKYPVVTYDVNGGSFKTGMVIPATSHAKGEKGISVETGSDKVERTGYTFVGWKTEDLGETPVTFADGDTPRTFTMPTQNVTFTAQWKIETEEVSLVLDPAGSDAAVAYTISGTYKTKVLNNQTGEYITTTLDLADGSNATTEGYVAGSIVKATSKKVSYGTEINFSVEVDEKYNSDNLTVTVKETGDTTDSVVYKPNKVVGNKYDYTISNITKNLTVTISGAVKKSYDIHYVYANAAAKGATLSEPYTGYNAGDTYDLPTVNVDSDSPYEFVGWYATKEAADAVTKRNDGKTEGTSVVTGITANDRGAKTYYAAWVGKEYTVNYHTGTGATGNGATSDKSQTFRYGSTDSLNAFTDEVMYPDVKGPNNVAFLGWGDGTNKTVLYTDGEAVLDMPKTTPISDTTKCIELYAVWDIENVTVTINSGEGRFADGSTMKQISVPFYSSLTEALEDYKESDFERIGYGLGNPIKWAYIETPDTQITETNLLKDVTITPIWSPATFSVNYYINGTKTVTVNNVAYNGNLQIGYNDTYNLAKEFTDSSKKLIGWSKNSNNSSLISYVHGETICFTETATATLYPVFGDSDKHYITYDINGGSWTGNAPAATLISGESTSLTTNAKSREGYDFAGWATSATATEPTYTDAYTVATNEDVEDVVLHAVWTPHEYTIKFEKGTAPEISNQDAYANSADVQSMEPVLKSGETLKESQTFKYGTAEALQSVQYEFPGFTFVGWADKNDASKKVIFKDRQSIKDLTKDNDDNYLTLVAVWALDTPITITYNANNGVGSKPANSQYIKLSDPVSVAVDSTTVPKYDNVDDTKNDSCTFLGWSSVQHDPISAGVTYTPADEEKYVAANATERTIPVSASTTLYAVWQKKAAYKVVYDANGGIGAVPKDDAEYIADSTAASAVNVKFDGTISKVGYTFVGWSTSADATEATYTKNGTNNTFKITKDTTLYAIWAPITYKVEYYNGATQIGETLEYKYDEEITLNDGSTVVSKDDLGIKFAGWSFKDGGTVSYAGGEKVSNLSSSSEAVVKLYAVTEERVFLVTLDDNIGIAEKLSVNNKKYNRVTVKVSNKTTTDTTVSYYLKYNDSLADITIPSMKGYDFNGYTIEGVDGDYYDSDGNVVKTLDDAAVAKAAQAPKSSDEGAENEDVVTLKAAWKPHKFCVDFIQDEKTIDSANVTYGEDFKMPATVKGVSLSSDYKVIGWTPDIDLSAAANSDKVAEMEANNKIFYVDKTYDADILASLYNNDRANLTFYPVYKTTVNYKVYFSSEDQKNVTNLPETQEVAWGDTFEVGFDEVILRVPYRKGYTFLGWSTENRTTAEYPYPVDENVEYGIENVKNDIVLYAVWEEGESDVSVSKEDALNRLQDSYDTLMATGNYTGAQAEALDVALKAGQDLINNADVDTVDEVTQALIDAKDKLAKVENDQQANSATKTLEDAKTNAADRLEDVYDAKNQSDYRAAQQTELTNAKNAGIAAINAATTPEAVAEALANAKKAINSVKTDSTLTKEEEEAAAKKAAEEAAAKKAAEEAAAKKAAEEAAAKKAADQAAANAVITKINAIGSPVTADSKSAIDAARNAYNALTADQKQYISQEIVTILTTAEATYKSVTTPKPTYFGEWVDGVWYNADGSQTYGPKGGWKSNSTGWWYEDEVGWYPANCWQKIDGQWYYFDSSGYRAENEWRGGYWLGADGAWTYQPTGSWHLDGYGWWYEDTTGWYPTNCWLKIDGYWYYFGGDGYMLTNQYIDGYWVGADGACQ